MRKWAFLLLMVPLFACPKNIPGTEPGDSKLLNEYYSKLEGYVAQSRGGGLSCDDRCKISEDGCEVSRRTCEITGRYPEDRTDLKKRCTDSQEQCAQFTTGCTQCKAK